MKTTSTFFLFFVLFIGSIKGQSWAPTGAKWMYAVRHAFSANIDTISIQSTGDTIILGKQCKVLQKSTQTCDLRRLTEFMYSDSGKVFYYDDSLNIFQTLYNFNDTVGATTTMFRTRYPSVDSVMYIVDSVTTVTLNGVTLKELIVHFSHITFGDFPPYGAGRIIERIGETDYMFPWSYGACDDQFGGPLRCYTDDSIGFYDFKTAPSCDYILTGIHEIQRDINSIVISPNPFPSSTDLQFNTYLTNAEVIIFDLLGNEMLHKTISGNSVEIKKGRLANGVYFVKVSDEERQWVGKLMVE